MLETAAWVLTTFSHRQHTSLDWPEYIPFRVAASSFPSKGVEWLKGRQETKVTCGEIMEACTAYFGEVSGMRGGAAWVGFP